MSSRREFLKWSALGLGSACLLPRARAQSMGNMSMPQPQMGGGALCKHVIEDHPQVVRLIDPNTLARFVDPLPIPPVLRARNGETLDISMRESHQRLHRDLAPARLWTYGDSMPGPTIEARSGTELRINFHNDLPSKHFLPIDHGIMGAEPDKPEVRAITHLHGAKVQTSSDGWPEDWYVPGKSRLHIYPNQQEAAPLWYHDHAMGINRLNIYAGLFGNLFLRDEYEDALGLPSGEQEIPLTLSDRFITPEGQIYYPVSGSTAAPWVSEVFGNAMLVNGTLWPYLDVQPRRYRFRVLNAANARFFRLGLSGRMPFQQIGSDQGLLAAPVTQKHVSIAPAERVDLIVDFSGLAGQQVALYNDAQPILQFRVGTGRTQDSSKVPPTLRSIERTAEAQASQHRVLTLDEYDDCTQAAMLMLLNGKRWMDPITERVKLGDTEIWSLVNLTEDTHPIHLHMVRFQILDRRPIDAQHWLHHQQLFYIGDAQPPEPGEMGWKDIAQAYPLSVTRIIVKFDGYTGKYVWHCHLLEHESNEMMRPFEVV